MPVNAKRSITINLSGDVILDKIFEAADNDESPGMVEVFVIGTGSTIQVPSSSTFTVTCATIIPPAGNTEAITLKGFPTDIGVFLHPTDPTSLAISGLPTFILSTVNTIEGLRIVWT